MRRQFLKFARALRADYASVQNCRAKYHQETIPIWHWPIDIVRKIGLQMACNIRFMQLSRDICLPVVPQVMSRLIRYTYGAEIHWNASIAPGISIVHGNGLVISHKAHVSSGCILFHNVTLGESTDPLTREVGAPYLEKNVHVGPGAVLLGPIRVGEGSKIMAGAVLAQSIPAYSIVKPSAVSIGTRH
jgi:serine acetyltransferase